MTQWKHSVNSNLPTCLPLVPGEEGDSQGGVFLSAAGSNQLSGSKQGEKQ